MKKLFKLGFMSLILSSLMVMSGCYKSDINDLEKDVNELRKSLAEEVLTFEAEILRVEGIISILDAAVKTQEGLITQLQTDLDKLEGDMNLTNPESALSKAIAAGDLATLESAKRYAEDLRDALLEQINPLKDFLALNGDGEFVVNEPVNDMLNGTYPTFGDFVTALTAHLSSLKGMIDQNILDIGALQITVGEHTTQIGALDTKIGEIYGLLGDLETAIGEGKTIAQAFEDIHDRLDAIESNVIDILETILPGIQGDISNIKQDIIDIRGDITAIEGAIGTMGDFWDDFTGETVWEAIGYNYAKTLAIYNRLDNLNDVDGRTLENFVDDVDQFISDTETELAGIQARFAGFGENQTINDFIAAAITAKLGNLTGTGGTTYTTVTAMVNGEIIKLDEKLTKDIDDKIKALKEELEEYVDNKIKALRGELLGVMQEMVTAITLMQGNDMFSIPAVSYDDNIGFAVIKEVVTTNFGPEGEIVFTKGNIVLSADPEPQPVLIKVTPDNVDISSADFVLFDSEMRDYLVDGTFTYTVSRYNGGLLTRGITQNGLWVVTLTIAKKENFPIEGTLVSLGIVNNMVDAAAPDRIVSTGNVVDATTSVEPYDPVYYESGNAAYPVYSVTQMSIPMLINAVSNSGPNDVWTTVPSVDPTTGLYTPGTEGTDDDRSSIAPIIHNISDSYAGFEVYPTSSYDALRGWYVEFKSGIPTATTEEEWGGELNQVRSIDNNDIDAPVLISIPLLNALHREVVEFNVHGVNVDGTLVDPDGVPFTIAMEAKDYVETDTNGREFTVLLDEAYGPGSWNEFFYTDEIPFDITALGFTPQFMQGLTAAYSIELADPAYVIDGVTTNPLYGQPIPASGAAAVNADNELLGVMQTSDDNGSNWADVSTTTDWGAVTHIRFAGVDPKAFMPGETYTGELILTEDPATTLTGLTPGLPGIDGTTVPAISLTFPISITLQEVLTFDTSMMDYKQSMGTSLIVWPTATLPDAIHNFDTSFDFILPALSANVTFESADNHDVTGHTTTIPNIVSNLSKPGALNPFSYSAFYTYGPVWKTAYGDGNFLAPWINNPFNVEFRNRMDWVEIVDTAPTFALSTITTTLSNLDFVFSPMNESGMGSNTFTLKQAIAAPQEWVLDPTIPGTSIATEVRGTGEVDKYFSLSFNADGSLIVNTAGGASLNPGQEVVLDLIITIIDQFAQPHDFTITLTING